MKIEKFLDWIQKNLLNYPNIDFKTVKMFIDKFYCCLSKREQDRYNISIQMIREYTSKQLNLEGFIEAENIKHLETELFKLKESETKS